MHKPNKKSYLLIYIIYLDFNIKYEVLLAFSLELAKLPSSGWLTADIYWTSTFFMPAQWDYGQSGADWFCHSWYIKNTHAVGFNWLSVRIQKLGSIFGRRIFGYHGSNCKTFCWSIKLWLFHFSLLTFTLSFSFDALLKLGFTIHSSTILLTDNKQDVGLWCNFSSFQGSQKGVGGMRVDSRKQL